VEKIAVTASARGMSEMQDPPVPLCFIDTSKSARAE